MSFKLLLKSFENKFLDRMKRYKRTKAGAVVEIAPDAVVAETDQIISGSKSDLRRNENSERNLSITTSRVDKVEEELAATPHQIASAVSSSLNRMSDRLNPTG